MAIEKTSLMRYNDRIGLVFFGRKRKGGAYEQKAIVIVLDSVGIGELPDAANYGDKGADTLGHIINTCHPKLPHLMELGLANIDGASFPGRVDAPKGCFGKLREVSAGKDTTTGHWEIAGVQLAQAFPDVPEWLPAGFHREV